MKPFQDARDFRVAEFDALDTSRAGRRFDRRNLSQLGESFGAHFVDPTPVTFEFIDVAYESKHLGRVWATEYGQKVVGCDCHKCCRKLAVILVTADNVAEKLPIKT
ncbi:MAG TPA: hypothetical protein VK807_11830 [Gemmatimonadaceae bacterium]|nr:hypothetical protein [Gemmatimonadaceae bacterium]